MVTSGEIRPSAEPRYRLLAQRYLSFRFAIIRRVANVQVRDVPEDVHRRLKAQAAMAGQSLNEFLVARMSDIARTPSVAELAERIRRRGPYAGPSSAELIRQDRDER
jgi:antitoxin FitA